MSSHWKSLLGVGTAVTTAGLLLGTARGRKVVDGTTSGVIALRTLVQKHGLMGATQELRRLTFAKKLISRAYSKQARVPQTALPAELLDKLRKGDDTLVRALTIVHSHAATDTVDGLISYMAPGTDGLRIPATTVEAAHRRYGNDETVEAAFKYALGKVTGDHFTEVTNAYAAYLLSPGRG